MHSTSLSRRNWNSKRALATWNRSKTSPKALQKKKKQIKWLEAVATEMRAELNHIEVAEETARAELRRLQRNISEIRNANRLAATNGARTQLYIDYILHRLDD